jgi:hypothetical protein
MTPWARHARLAHQERIFWATNGSPSSHKGSCPQTRGSLWRALGTTGPQCVVPHARLCGTQRCQDHDVPQAAIPGNGMTGRSQMATAVRDLCANPGRSMGIIQASIIGYFEAHQITKFAHPLLVQAGGDMVMYAMTTGNWSTQSAHSAGNMMAAAVAVKTGIIPPCVSFPVRRKASTDDVDEPAGHSVPHPPRLHAPGSSRARVASPSVAHLPHSPVHKRGAGDTTVTCAPPRLFLFCE